MKRCNFYLSGALLRVLLLKVLALSAALVPLISTHVKAQDFTDIGKRRPLLLSGSAGAQVSTRLSTQSQYSSPFSYLLNLQLTPTIYGFSMPLSLSYADSRLSYSQPFSRYSIQPTYKWITAYLGRTTLNMHPYGLSDRQFDGVGISLQPKNFPLKFMAMYGRFAKAFVDTASATAIGAAGTPGTSGSQANSFQQIATYKRTGYAFKLDFEHKNQHIGLHFFTAKDKANTLQDWAWPNPTAKPDPAANAVLALDFSFRLWEDLTLSGQAALSNYVGNITQETTAADGFTQKISSLFLKHRPTSQASTALKVGASYKWLSLNYERISPNYQSMGAYYFNQDFENLVLDFSHTFSFVDIRAEIGWQHDDLSGRSAERQDRVVGSAYLNFRINENFTTNASYSNFTSYTQTKPVDLTAPDDPLIQDYDTVPFRQISQQAQWAFLFRTSNKAKYAQEAGIDFSYQSSRLSLQQNFSDYFYGNLRHSINLGMDWRLQTAVSVSACLSGAAGTSGGGASDAASETGATAKTLRYGIGPTLSLSKPFLDKTLLASVSGSYYLDMQGKRMQSGILGMRFALAYTLKKSHNFGFNMSTRLCTAGSSATKKNMEFQAQISYRYTFSLDPFKNCRKRNSGAGDSGSCKKHRKTPGPGSHKMPENEEGTNPPGESRPREH